MATRMVAINHPITGTIMGMAQPLSLSLLIHAPVWALQSGRNGFVAGSEVVKSWEMSMQEDAVPGDPMAGTKIPPPCWVSTKTAPPSPLST